LLLSDDSATWIAVGLALGAVVVALAVAVVVLVALRRKPPASTVEPVEGTESRELVRALQAALSSLRSN
jgi:hypothetical protein